MFATATITTSLNLITNIEMILSYSALITQVTNQTKVLSACIFLLSADYQCTALLKKWDYKSITQT